MENNFGFRINKYLNVSLVIGLIDLMIFYAIGKTYNYMNLFNTIISNWNYAFIYVACILLAVYLNDVLFFYDRNKKFKFLLIFKEPFKDWTNYLRKNIEPRKKDLDKDFYSVVYFNVRNNKKIIGIRNDEILIRDIVVHLILTNTVLLIFFFILEQVKLSVCIFNFLLLILVYILLNLSYRNYLKYFISEIYVEYINAK